LRDNLNSTLAGPTQAAPPQSPDASQESPPLQSDEAASTDDQPQRFLVRRTYSLSDPSPYPQRPPVAAAPASPDGSLSLNDAYLEYLRRLSAA